MLQKIEALAKATGYTCMLLESGELLTSAMHLYRSNGYLEIENYGPYQNDTEAVCMKKIFKLSRFNFFMRNKKDMAPSSCPFIMRYYFSGTISSQ